VEFEGYSVPNSSGFSDLSQHTFDESDHRVYSTIQDANDGRRPFDGSSQHPQNYGAEYPPTGPLYSKDTAHYDFGAATNSDTKPQGLDQPRETSTYWIDPRHQAFEPPSQEKFYNAHVQDAAQPAFENSFQGSSNWGAHPGQEIPSNPLAKQYDNLGFISPDAVSNNSHDANQNSQPQPQQDFITNHDTQYDLSFRDTQTDGFVKQETGHNATAGGKIEVFPAHDLQFLPDANDEDDKYWDVSDDEINYEEYDHDPEAGYGEIQQSHLRDNDLGALVALQASQDRHDQRLRTYHSLIDDYGPNMLATYHPSQKSSPLNDPITARIFCHFINVLGPSISMYERHPTNPSLIFQGQPVPASQQHIWSCMPS